MAQVPSSWTLGQVGCGPVAWGICRPSVSPSYMMPRGWLPTCAGENLQEAFWSIRGSLASCYYFLT